VHGSAPDIAGRGIANPLAAISAAAMLLDHIGETRHAGWLRSAVDATLRDGILAPDLGGTATTMEVLKAVLTRLHHVQSVQPIEHHIVARPLTSLN
jgi:isocitrate/isopropylmalate dehydrogenase